MSSRQRNQKAKKEEKVSIYTDTKAEKWKVQAFIIQRDCVLVEGKYRIYFLVAQPAIKRKKPVRKKTRTNQPPPKTNTKNSAT
jgi:hypothetical protein